MSRDQSLFIHVNSLRQLLLSTGQYIATSKQGFIQQIVSGWVRHGYYFYVQGELGSNKDLLAFDRKLIARYPLVMKSGRRHSRKRRGIINVAYLRYDQHWIMLATRGKYEETKEGWLDWRACEAERIRNCMRGQSIQFFGYSISYVRGGYARKRNQLNPDGPAVRDYCYRVRVQISRRALAKLKAELTSMACCRDEEWFRSRFSRLPYEPYGPVRKQLFDVLRQVNAARATAGRSKISSDVVRTRHRRVSVFGDWESRYNSENKKC